MIKTGIVSSAYFGINDYAQGIQKMKSHGYDCMDYQDLASNGSVLFTYKDEAFERHFKDFGACAKAEGIEIYQMHGLWPRFADGDISKTPQDVELYVKELNAAHYMGCKRIVLHPSMPYGWGEEPCKEKAFEETAKMIERLLPYAQKYGVILCVENMPFAKTHSFSSIEEVKRLVGSFHHPNVKACLDTGHLNCTQENMYETILTLGEDLGAMHVHDDVNRQDRHMIPFQGEVDWDGFVAGLKAIKFQGCISLETRISPTTPEPMLEEMRKGLAGIAKWLAKQSEA
ncbi:MAG: sugar phosphate isomerase/epimerase [Clostridia bacterium]|nr:sugar phosphate isomerase/epimerase [Clostridia bacterium]